jgi:hypothetical protein
MDMNNAKKSVLNHLPYGHALTVHTQRLPSIHRRCQ